GTNAFDIAAPDLTNATIENFTSPFFIFQITCTLLWMLDSYWYYSLFTFAMLVLLEVQFAARRVDDMALLREQMVFPERPVLVYIPNSVITGSGSSSGSWQLTSSRALLPGYITVLLANKTAPQQADVLLLQESACLCDESMLTGETLPQAKTSYTGNSTINVGELQQEQRESPTPSNVGDRQNLNYRDDFHTRFESLYLPLKNEHKADTGDILQEKKSADPDSVFGKGHIEVERMQRRAAAIEFDHVIGLPVPAHERDLYLNGQTITAEQEHQEGLSSTAASMRGTPGQAKEDEAYALGMVLHTSYDTKQGSLIRTIVSNAERATLETSQSELYYFLAILLVFGICSCCFLLWDGLPRSQWRLFLSVSHVITSAVPPEFPTTLSFVTSLFLVALHKLRIFCTEAHRFQYAGGVTTCCFDKTGTLSSSDYTVADVVSDVKVKKSRSKDTVVAEQLVETPEMAQLVLGGCNSLVYVGGEIVGDPAEAAALSHAGWKIGLGGVITETGVSRTGRSCGSSDNEPATTSMTGHDQIQKEKANEDCISTAGTSTTSSFSQVTRDRIDAAVGGALRLGGLFAPLASSSTTSSAVSTSSTQADPSVSVALTSRTIRKITQHPFRSELQRMSVLVEVIKTSIDQMETNLRQASDKNASGASKTKTKNINNKRRGDRDDHSNNFKNRIFSKNDSSTGRLLSLVKGSPEMLKGRIEFVSKDAEKAFENKAQKLARKGLRVLALAYKEFPPSTTPSGTSSGPLSREDCESGLIFAGFLALKSHLKPRTSETIRELRQTGHRCVMITGDACATACHVAKEAGLANAAAEMLVLVAKGNTFVWRREASSFVPGTNSLGLISSSEGGLGEEQEEPCLPFDTIEQSHCSSLNSDCRSWEQRRGEGQRQGENDNNEAGRAPYAFCVSFAEVTSSAVRKAENGALWKKLVQHVTVFARTSPDEKKTILDTLKDECGETTLMIGDGLNDVGALKRAHVGISLLGTSTSSSSTTTTSSNNTHTAALLGATASKSSSSSSRALRRDKLDSASSDVKTSNPARSKKSGARDKHKDQQEDEEELDLMEDSEGSRDPHQRERRGTAELGEASIASPFTYRGESVKCVPKLLQAGRGAVCVTLQMYKIMGVNSIVLACGLFVVTLDGTRTGEAQALVESMAISALFFLISRSKVEKLSRQRPVASLFSFSCLGSMILQITTHLACL
ncbi:unnamed protein product, partial [Amoebophrya sp. A25]